MIRVSLPQHVNLVARDPDCNRVALRAHAGRAPAELHQGSGQQ